MPNSSVFIFLMLRALYRMICKSSKKNFGKKSLNVPNVKLLSIFFFNIFGFFMPFWWEWQLALYILSDFPGIKNLSGLNDLNSLNNLSGLNDLFSLNSSKNLLSWCYHQQWHQNDLFWSLNVEWIFKNPLYCWFLALFLLEAVEGVQHQNNKNWWIRHKCPYLMNM